MGIRANALTDHRVPDYRAQAAVVSLLTPTVSAARAVADYWRAAQTDYADAVDAWSAYRCGNSAAGTRHRVGCHQVQIF